jgi:ATP-binding cassette subfamily C protein LapB
MNMFWKRKGRDARPLTLGQSSRISTATDLDQISFSDLDRSAASYLSHLGQPVTVDRLWTGLPSAASGMDMALLARALGNVGYEMSHHAAVGLSRIETPCLLRLTNGNFVLVIGRENDGQYFVAADPASQARVLVAQELLAEKYAGETLSFFPRLDALAERHVGQRPNKHWFWRHFEPMRGQVFDVVLASGFANLLAVAVSLFALQVYDRVVPNQNEATLWVLASGAALAIGLEFLLRISRARLIDTAGREIEIAVNRDLYERLLNMRLDARPMPPGSLVNTMREFASVKEFFAVSAVGVVTDLPFVLIFLLVIYAIAGPLVVIVALGALVMIIAGLVFQYRIHALSRDMLGGATAALRLLTETAYGLETLRSHRFAPLFQRNWEEVTTLNALQSSRHRRLSAGLSFLSSSLQMLTYVAAITGGVYLFFADALSVGGIIAVSILTSRTLAPIVQLSGILSRWKYTTAALEALEVIAESPQDRDAARSYIRRTQIAGDLRLRDIRTAYPGAEDVQLVIPDLKLNPGARVAVLGENGSGKSLLLRILAGLYVPNQGSYLVDGLEAQQIDPDDLRKAVGYLPQEPRLFKGTLRENLSMGASQVSDTRLFEALDFAGLGKLVASTTRGLDLEIHDGGEGLSVGQRAAVGLARLHLQNPSIVLLDEPTAAMDSRSEATFVVRFKEWLAERSAIICTHRMPLMDAVDEVVILADGRMLAHGPKDEILAKFTRVGGGAQSPKLPEPRVAQ